MPLTTLTASIKHVIMNIPNLMKVFSDVLSITAVMCNVINMQFQDPPATAECLYFVVTSQEITPLHYRKREYILLCSRGKCPTIGKKEMFYLTTHSTYFYYLWLYGVNIW